MAEGDPVLTPSDDFPIHQTAMPVAHPASGDPNHYDRFFFNGYHRDGDYFFGVAMALYPNRSLIDAGFSIVHDGRQRSVFGSGRIPLDRTQTEVGPIRIELVEPLRVNRVVVDAPEHGIRAELTYTARSVAIEEPKQTIIDGTKTVMDYTRLTQAGTWQGWFEVDGDRIELDPSTAYGTKDRSWGVRPVGAPTPGAPAPNLLASGGILFLWAPMHFDDHCRFMALFERPDGERWYQSTAITPVLGAGDPVFGTPDVIRHVPHVDWAIDFAPGTRRSRSAEVTYRYPDREPEVVTFEALLDFQMKGIGYTHPLWGHGNWHGEEATGADGWELASLDPLAPDNIHIEQVCRVRLGDQEGVGILEQLIFGPHARAGFTDFLDGASA